MINKKRKSNINLVIKNYNLYKKTNLFSMSLLDVGFYNKYVLPFIQKHETIISKKQISKFKSEIDITKNVSKKYKKLYQKNNVLINYSSLDKLIKKQNEIYGSNHFYSPTVNSLSKRNDLSSLYFYFKSKKYPKTYYFVDASSLQFYYDDIKYENINGFDTSKFSSKDVIHGYFKMSHGKSGKLKNNKNDNIINIHFDIAKTMKMSINFIDNLIEKIWDYEEVFSESLINDIVGSSNDIDLTINHFNNEKIDKEINNIYDYFQYLLDYENLEQQRVYEKNEFNDSEIISQFNSYFIKNVSIGTYLNNLYLNLFMYNKEDFNNKKFVDFYYLISSIFLSGIKKSNLKTKNIINIYEPYLYNSVKETLINENVKNEKIIKSIEYFNLINNERKFKEFCNVDNQEYISNLKYFMIAINIYLLLINKNNKKITNTYYNEYLNNYINNIDNVYELYNGNVNVVTKRDFTTHKLVNNLVFDYQNTFLNYFNNTEENLNIIKKVSIGEIKLNDNKLKKIIDDNKEMNIHDTFHYLINSYYKYNWVKINHYFQ